jgi:hypothetical protein
MQRIVLNVAKKVMDLHYDAIDKSYRTEASNLMQNVPFGKAAVFLHAAHIHIIHFIFKRKPGMY